MDNTMKQALTKAQIELIERWFDGDVVGEQAREATALVASSAEARELHDALKEIRVATEVAESQAWSKATPPSIDAVVGACESSENLADAPLSQLAPLLERFFDGETDDFEAELVAQLIDTRDDVADYLAGLDEVKGGVAASLQELGDRAPMANFWDSIASRLDDDAFRPADHAMLVQRFHDGAVSDAERAQVESWKSAQVTAGLDAFAEIHLATNAAMDHATEGVDFSRIWGAVEAVMDADVEAQGDNIVSLGKARREQVEKRSGFSRSSLGAIAALVAAVLVGGIFSKQLFGPERVIVEKTVVIVDSVEYAPGASIMIDSPVQQASAISNADSDNEEEEPTVIWILDEGDGTLEDVDSAPSKGEANEKKPIGQPI